MDNLALKTAIFTICTVLTESPFDELTISTDTSTATFDIDFTVNSTYSGYGYQGTN